MFSTNKFYEDIKEIIVHWQKFNPTRCHVLGIHNYDGLFPDYSTIAIEDRIIEIKEDIVHLIALRRDYDDPYTIFEFNLVKLTLDQELYDLTVLKEYEFNPFFYIEPLMILDQSLTVKSFDSLDNRIKLLTEYLENLPTYLSYPKEHLIQSLPAIHLDLAMDSLNGIVNFFKKDILSFLSQSNNKSVVNTCKQSIDQAVTVLTEFLTYLEVNHKPYTHENYSLGKDTFLMMLKKREMVTFQAEQLLEIGQADLDKNFATLQSIINKHEPDFIDSVLKDFIAEKDLLNYARNTIDRIGTFLKEKDIVDIPAGEVLRVIETPESVKRHGFAGLNPSGPFETKKDIESYLFLTFPDSNWDNNQKGNYYKFFNKAIFDHIIISEVLPGQFLKFLFGKYKTKSNISNLFSRASSMLEGYPNYVQEMMVENNYNPWPEEPDKIKVGQLLITILRNVRFLVSVGIHCFNMPLQEAKNLFVEKALLTDETALMEIKRAVMVPMYLNYTLGKLLIKKLKLDYQQEHKENFSLKQFHNELLSYGSPPIALLRQVMLKDTTIIPEIL